MTPWSDALVRWLIDYYSAASVVLAAALIAGCLMRASATRNALGWAALGGVAVLAALCAAPGWSRFAVISETQEARALHAEAWAAIGSVESEPKAASIEKRGAPPRALMAARESGGEEVDSQDRSRIRPGRSPADAPRTPLSLGGSAPYVAMAFLLGVALLLARRLLGAVRVRRLCRRASAAPQATLDELKRIADGAESLPRLLVSSSMETAAAWGLLRPTIVLPQSSIRSGLAIGPILAHEWAHIRRGDLWLLALLCGVQVLLYAHPLFWMLRRRIRNDLELIADAAAADRCGRCEYAEALVAWARFQAKVRVRPIGALGIWDSRALFTRRISMLLDERIRLEIDCSRRWRIGSGLASLALVAGLSLFTLRPAPATFAAPPGDAAPRVASKVAAGPAAQATTKRAEEASRRAELVGGSELAPISGVCLDEKQSPLAGARVRLFRTELSEHAHLRPTGRAKFVQSFVAGVKAGEEGEGFSSGNYATTMQSPESQRLVAEVHTDEKGSFRFSGLRADQAWMEQRSVMTVVVQSPGKGTQCEHAIVSRGRDESLFVRPMLFTLPSAVSLRGRVASSEGKPVAGAVVSCPDACSLAKPLPGIMCAVTDADGRFEIADLPPFDVADAPPHVLDFGVVASASAAASVEHPDYAPLVVEYVRLPAVVEASLQRPATLEGQVIDEESGRPAAKATVRWLHERGFTGATLTDDQGRYAAAGLPPGKYTVRAWRADRLDAEREVELRSGENRVVLQLTQGALLKGSVIDEATGKAPAHLGNMPMTVHVLPPGGKPAEGRIGYVQRDGTFSIAVPPGKRLLGFYHPCWRLIEEPRWRESGVEAVKGQTVEVALRVAAQRRELSLPEPIRAGEDDAPPHAVASSLPTIPLSEKALVALLKSTEFIELETETVDGRELITGIGLAPPSDAALEEGALRLAWLSRNLLAHIRAFPKLRRLTLYPPPGCDAALESLRGLENLESFMLADALDLTDAGVAHLAALPNLKVLALAGAQLDDKSLRRVGRMPKLEILMIGGVFTDEGLSHLRGAHLKQLQIAAMKGARLTDQGLKALAELTTLENLELGQMDEGGENCWNVTDEGLRFLAALTRLEGLALRGEHITDAGLVHLRGLKKLKQLELDRCAVTAAGAAELMKWLPNLKVKGVRDAPPPQPSP